MPVADRPRLQVSLGRFLITANVYGTVACLCLIPAFNLWDLGVGSGWGLVLLELVVVPLAWILTSFVMIRDRDARAVAIAALLLGPVSAVLGFSTWTYAPLAWKIWRRGPLSIVQFDVPGVIVLAIVVPVLTLAIVALARRLARLHRSGLGTDSSPRLPDPSLSPEP